MANPVKQFKLNLPEDVKVWLENQAVDNLRSQSGEIIFAIREKMKCTREDGT